MNTTRRLPGLTILWRTPNGLGRRRSVTTLCRSVTRRRNIDPRDPSWRVADLRCRELRESAPSDQRSKPGWPRLAPVVGFHVARGAERDEIRGFQVAFHIVNVMDVKADAAIRPAETAGVSIAFANRLTKAVATPFSRVLTFSDSPAQLRLRHLLTRTFGRTGKAATKVGRVLSDPSLEKHAADGAGLASVVDAFGRLGKCPRAFGRAGSASAMHRSVCVDFSPIPRRVWLKCIRPITDLANLLFAWFGGRYRLGFLTTPSGAAACSATNKCGSKFVWSPFELSTADDAVSVGNWNAFQQMTTPAAASASLRKCDMRLLDMLSEPLFADGALFHSAIIPHGIVV